MKDAKTTAEAIVAQLDIGVREVTVIEAAQMRSIAVQLITEALEARAPRVVSDVDVVELCEKARKENEQHPWWWSGPKFDIGFLAGFRKAAELNAIASVEAAMPSEEEEARAAGYKAKLAPQDFRAGIDWLRAEVLRRLGGK